MEGNSVNNRYMKVNKRKKRKYICSLQKKRTRRFTQKSKILEQNMVLLEMKMETTEIKSDKP